MLWDQKNEEECNLHIFLKLLSTKPIKIPCLSG